MMKVEYRCPACGGRMMATPSLEGAAAGCPACHAHIEKWERVPGGFAYDHEPPRPAAKEDDSPSPVYKESPLLQVVAFLLLLVGGLVLTFGLLLDPSVSTGAREPERVNNFGLLAQKQTMILGGLFTVGLAILVKILAVVQGVSGLYRKGG